MHPKPLRPTADSACLDASPPPPCSPSCLPGASSVLASLQPCTELSTGVQQVEVVAAHKVLSQPNDGGLQAGLAVVVGGVLRHITSQLGNLWGRSLGWGVGERGGDQQKIGGGLQARPASVVGRVFRHVCCTVMCCIP
jgi:hypothetical protein